MFLAICYIKKKISAADYDIDIAVRDWQRAMRQVLPVWFFRICGMQRQRKVENNMINATKDTFQSEVLDAKGTVLVDFWADWLRTL